MGRLVEPAYQLDTDIQAPLITFQQTRRERGQALPSPRGDRAGGNLGQLCLKHTVWPVSSPSFHSQSSRRVDGTLWEVIGLGGGRACQWQDTGRWTAAATCDHFRRFTGIGVPGPRETQNSKNQLKVGT